jgi:IS605 OrfB family transposase
MLKRELARLRRAQKSVSRSEQKRLEAETVARAAGTLGARERLPKSKRHQAKEAVISRIHARIAAIRSEFHHTLAKRLVESYPVIGVENLAVANMIRNRHLSRAIADVGWSSFLVILRYKAEECGTLIVTAGRWSPSSQKCSACGFKNPAVKDLSVRRWTCPNCGVIHDRDINAGVNLIPTDTQVDKARLELAAARAEEEKKRESRKSRTKKASETKKAKKTARLAKEETDQAVGAKLKHSARLARHAAKPNFNPLAVTSTDSNARREPVRPPATSNSEQARVVGKRLAAPDSAVARIETSREREEARTERSGLPDFPDSRTSLRGLDPPAIASVVSRH